MKFYIIRHAFASVARSFPTEWHSPNQVSTITAAVSAAHLVARLRRDWGAAGEGEPGETAVSPLTADEATAAPVSSRPSPESPQVKRPCFRRRFPRPAAGTDRPAPAERDRPQPAPGQRGSGRQGRRISAFLRWPPDALVGRSRLFR
jgi:hypothetical protein